MHLPISHELTGKHELRDIVMRTSKLLRPLLLAVCVLLFFAGVSECGAQEHCQNCQGRCLYCVDGQCIPRRHTFGHYQTHWRRWPVPPPTIPVEDTLPPGVQTGEPGFDLPAAGDEAELDPDLVHQRETLPAVETPMELELRNEAVKPDPFQDEAPSDVPNVNPAPSEGSTSRNMPPRMLPRQVSQYTGLPQPMERNPLRAVVTAPLIAPAVPQSTRRAGFEQPVVSPPLARPFYANPLR